MAEKLDDGTEPLNFPTLLGQPRGGGQGCRGLGLAFSTADSWARLPQAFLPVPPTLPPRMDTGFF